MKPTNYIKLIAVVMVCIISVSCDKRMDKIADETLNFNGKALVQIVMTSPNAARNYVYVDSRQVTGALLSAGSLFPASATGVAFAVEPGLRDFLIRDTLSTTTQIPLSFAQNFDAGKRYSVFVYDTITSMKQKTVRDDIIIPTEDSTARIRFANFVYNPTAITAFDIYSARRKANIFTNVQVTEVTPFINIQAGLSDTFYIRPTGTTTNIQNLTGTTLADIRAIFTPTHTRSYTLLFRGSFRTFNTASTQVRQLVAYAH